MARRGELDSEAAPSSPSLQPGVHAMAHGHRGQGGSPQPGTPAPKPGPGSRNCTHRGGHGMQRGADSGGQSSRPVQTEQTERPEPHEDGAGVPKQLEAAAGLKCPPPRPGPQGGKKPPPGPTPPPQRPSNMPARLGTPGVLGGASVATVPELGRGWLPQPDQPCQGVRRPRTRPAASSQPCCPAPTVRPALLLPLRKTAAGRWASARPRGRGA